MGRARKNIDSSGQLRKKFITVESVCEICGSKENLEVHHKTPIVLGGKSNDENIEVLCESCHSRLHEKSRSELVRIGIEKSRNTPCEIYISMLDLCQKIKKELSHGEPLYAVDILDIAETCRCITKRIE